MPEYNALFFIGIMKESSWFYQVFCRMAWHFAWEHCQFWVFLKSTVSDFIIPVSDWNRPIFS